MGLAIVTGSASGIGEEISKTYLANGYTVFGVDQSPHSIEHPQYFHFVVDLTQPEQIEGFILQFKPDIENNVLINAAGIREIVAIDQLSLETWAQVFSVNVTAPFYLSQLFSNSLIQHKSTGNIINIASTSGILGEPNRTAYVSSKHALIGLTKQLAIEYGRYAIRANSISPGVTRTPLTEAYYHNPDQLNKILKGQFLDLLGTPKHVAEAAYFLGKKDSTFITGSNLVIDGGWTAGKLI